MAKKIDLTMCKIYNPMACSQQGQYYKADVMKIQYGITFGVKYHIRLTLLYYMKDYVHHL